MGHGTGKGKVSRFLRCGFLIALFVFAVFPSFAVSSPDVKPVTIILTGDVMVGRSVEERADLMGLDYPFKKISPVLKSADITIGNLENPLLASGMPEPKMITLRGHLAWAGVLKNAGFTVLSLANNHALDYGEGGFNQTIKALEGAGITPIGTGEKYKVINVRGLRIALVARTAFPRRTHPSVIKKDELVSAISSAKKEADLVIVSLHWGVEYEDAPTAEQKELADECIKAGADVVFGHHPHVLQGLEVKDGKVVAYSMGNFLFDQGMPGTCESMILKLTIEGGKIARVDIIPTIIRDGRVYPAGGKMREKILTHLRSLSSALSAGLYITGTKAMLALSPGEYKRSWKADLDGDGAEEDLTIEDGIFSISEKGRTAFETPPDWLVEDVKIFDLMGYGKPQFIILAWKLSPEKEWKGDHWAYRAKPGIFANQLLVYSWVKGEPKPEWIGSPLPYCLRLFEFSRKDDSVFLTGTEEDYDDEAAEKGPFDSLYKWTGWQFVRKSAPEKPDKDGNVKNLINNLILPAAPVHPIEEKHTDTPCDTDNVPDPCFKERVNAGQVAVYRRQASPVGPETPVESQQVPGKP